jgi:hypothetical protein
MAERERLDCIVLPVVGSVEPSVEERLAGITRSAAELHRLGRDARWIVIDDGGPAGPAAPVLPAGHSLEAVPLGPDAGHGQRLRSALARASAELILRLPAVGTAVEFLKPLLARINAGKVKPDIVVAARPDRPAGLCERIRRRLHERIFRTVFGIVVSDPTSPVWLMRRRVAALSMPQSDGAFADFELLARANFVGFLIDELPMKAAWTGGPPGPADWKSIRRDARRLLRAPAFVRRTPPSASSTR